MDNDELYNVYQGAIESIEACSREYGVTIVIARHSKAKGVTKYSGKWKISVMEKTFYNEDFITALKDALIFVHNAHNPDNPLKQ
jgi:hypothetical protein